MKKNLFDLSGKVAIVTGASRGLGQYFGRTLAEAGADLVVTSRKVENCNRFKKEIESIGRHIIVLPLDVLAEESINNMVTKTIEYYGKIDILVNNAGCNIRKPVLEVTWDEWNKILNTNLRGQFFTAKAVAPHMIKNRYGRIINIGSVACVFGYAGITPYCASRGGVMQMTKSLADEWGECGINVNCLAPGWFKTKQNAVLYENKEWVEYITDRIPLKRTGKPDDLSGSIIFLASDASEYITGQVLFVDGGITTGATKATIEKSNRE